MNSLIKSLDGSHTVKSGRYNATYHSDRGALGESLYVFIEMGFRQAAKTQTKLRIFEMGFGTGLNCLLTCLNAQASGVTIDYFAVEKHPLDSAVIRSLNYPTLLEGSKTIFESIHAAGWNRECYITNEIRLVKLQGDLLELRLPDALQLVYFDAFAPGVQPELWSIDVFQRIFDKMENDALLVTYCANGEVKRKLRKSGFLVETLPGALGKREMTRARKSLRFE